MKAIISIPFALFVIPSFGFVLPPRNSGNRRCRGAEVIFASSLVDQPQLQNSDTSTVAPLTHGEQFIETLTTSNRDIDASSVQAHLDQLHHSYNADGSDCRYSKALDYNGDWLMETRPSFPDLLGYNGNDDALYTLGRLTFNMIQPGNVILSVQKITQHIHYLSDDPKCVDKNGKVIVPEFLPKSLREEIEEDPSELRSYRTDVHFTVEENGVQGVLQMDGYTIPNPDPALENRFSIWFTGGRCYALKDQDQDKWKDVFGTDLPKLKKRERFQLWMAKMMMGAEHSKGLQEDGSLTYHIKRPIGGHKTAFQQVLYLDDAIRITDGNRGTTVVVSRIE